MDIRAWVDRGGLYAGHTPRLFDLTQDVSPGLLHRLLTDPLVDGLPVWSVGLVSTYTPRMSEASRYRAWLDQPEQPLAEAWGLTKPQASRLLAFQFEVIGITG